MAKPPTGSTGRGFRERGAPLQGLNSFAGYNMRHLHQWYLERELPDPWQITLDEKPDLDDPDWIYRTRGP
ncbi:hypothetical protein CLV28_2632 [Sediminihabitans luteus]|uniref:Uncharacterized protein n=1 Tax=Sediminihabitans luteus TaxID=1138585 RepID=A0A2M9CCQ7_9CELL|nr:hypothetical protein CLV28_2632 [Sediminihabitans luteus]GII98844.1 hypothetical protein Slu03_12220 [Sediminihabitans luteus]